MHSEEIEIYALCHPVTEEIRYIGKAKNSNSRLKTHLSDSKRRKTPVYDWINNLLKNNLSPKVIILETVSIEAWKETETKIIKKYREQGFRLLNIANGGDEPFCSKEVRAKNGKNNAAMIHNDPKKHRIWELKKNIGLSLKQGYVKESTKVKLRALAVRRPELFAEWVNI